MKIDNKRVRDSDFVNTYSSDSGLEFTKKHRASVNQDDYNNDDSID